MEKAVETISVKLDKVYAYKLNEIIKYIKQDKSAAIRYAIDKAFDFVDTGNNITMEDTMEKILQTIRHNLMETIKIHGGRDFSDEMHGDRTDELNTMRYYYRIHNKINPEDAIDVDSLKLK